MGTKLLLFYCIKLGIVSSGVCQLGFEQHLFEHVEKIQKRAIKLVCECKRLQYIERLKYLKLPTPDIQESYD